MSDHKDAVYFDDEPTTDKRKAAYRELRLWKAGYLAAVTGGSHVPVDVANRFVEHLNAKRAALLAGT